MKKNNSVVSGLSWSFAEKILTDIIEAVVSILLARLLLPEDYGLVSLVQVFITITQIFVGNGLSDALIQRKDIDEEQISTVFYINLFIGVLLYCCLYFAAPYLASIKGNNKLLVSIIRVLAVKIPVASIYSIQHAYIKRTMQFKLFFYSSFVGTVLAGVVGVFMALRGFGVWALIASTLIDQIVDCLVLFATSRWFPKFVLKVNKTKEILIFGIQLLISQFITRAYASLRTLLQGVKYSGADLAFDVKGKKIPDMIVNTIDPSVNRVMFPLLSQKQDNSIELNKQLRKIVRYYNFLMSPVMIGIALTASSFVPIIFTNNWMFCVPYIQIYCVSQLISMFSIYDVRVLTACGKGKTIIQLQSIYTIIDIIVIAFVIYRFNNPMSLAISKCFCNIVYIFVYYFEVKKLANYSLKERAFDCGIPLLMSIVMGIAVYSLNNLMLGNYAMLVIKIVVGVIIYTIISIIIKFEPAIEILSRIKIFVRGKTVD